MLYVYLMSGSTDNPNAPSRKKSMEKFLAKIESGEISSVPAKERQEIHELPRWAKTALVMKAVDGLSYKEAAARVGKKGKTLSDYARSPAAEKWLASLQEMLEDPVAMAKAYMSANALSITLERFAFLEAAVAAGDYKEGDKILRDLQDRVGIMAKKQETGGINIKLTVGGGMAALEGPVIEAEWEESE